MRARVIGLCLLAYPRAVRVRDRDHLRDLATDLAEDHGTLREALGLLRGGVAERLRHAGRSRRAVLAVVAAAALVLAGLTWTATAQEGRAEVDVFGCAGRCADVEAAVASRVDDGWDCTERRGPDSLTWRCTRD
jgi:hypothetical protein